MNKKSIENVIYEGKSPIALKRVGITDIDGTNADEFTT